MAEFDDFGFKEEEILVRNLARRFLSEHLPAAVLREQVAASAEQAYESEISPACYDEALWGQIVELGWTGLAVPVSSGGVGMKMVAVAGLVEEVGRAALPSPLIATLQATNVLCHARERQAEKWLSRIAEGTAATLAITDAEGSWEASDTDVFADSDGDGALLRGTASFVQDARKAAFFVVSARGEEGIGLYCVSVDAPGVEIVPDRIVDLTRDQARVEFKDVAVANTGVIAPAGTGEEILERALPAMLVVVAADLCGAAEWQLQSTTEYARVRTQFDRPLGFFQAVKHPLVDMMIAVDRARSLLYAAGNAIDLTAPGSERLARMAKAAASDAADFCSSRSVQLHGGIGFSWESEVHIYLKRQKHNQFWLGDASHHRMRLAKSLSHGSH